MGRNGACPNRQQIIYHLFLNCRGGGGGGEKTSRKTETERQKKTQGEGREVEEEEGEEEAEEMSSIAQHRRDGCPRFSAFYYKQSRRIFT